MERWQGIGGRLRSVKERPLVSKLGSKTEAAAAAAAAGLRGRSLKPWIFPGQRSRTLRTALWCMPALVTSVSYHHGCHQDSSGYSVAGRPRPER